MTRTQRYGLVAAIYPNARGFAFVLFEGELSPVDWGVMEVRGRDRNKNCLRTIGNIFAQYDLDAVVIRETLAPGSCRTTRIRNLNNAIAELAEQHGAPVHAYSRARVRQTFGVLGLPTKDRIAEMIAKHIPAFERHLPSARKPWVSEKPSMGLFDAAALALTFFHAEGGTG